MVCFMSCILVVSERVKHKHLLEQIVYQIKWVGNGYSSDLSNKHGSCFDRVNLMSGNVITSHGTNLYQICQMLIRNIAGTKVLYRYWFRYRRMDGWIYCYYLKIHLSLKYWLGNQREPDATMFLLCCKALRWKDCSLVPLTSDVKRKGLSGLVLQDNRLSTPDPISLDTNISICQCWLAEAADQLLHIVSSAMMHLFAMFGDRPSSGKWFVTMTSNLKRGHIIPPGVCD